MVREAYHAAIDAIPSFSQAAAGLLEDAECDALAYLAFPAEHRRHIRTNNGQERTNRESSAGPAPCRYSRASGR